MEETKKNKARQAEGNKGEAGPSTARVRSAQDGKVTIVFKPGRDGEGAIPQGDGTWLADEVKAAYWVSIGYAEYFNEGV